MGFDLSFLPTVNAALNLAATALLVVGRRRIRSGDRQGHQRMMLAAFATSCLFLVLYVAHKVWRDFEHTSFEVDWARPFYLALLFSHVTLAMAVPPLAITLIVLGLRDRIARHRALARIAWPVWMYVSVTGVLIYLLLYPLNPGAH